MGPIEALSHFIQSFGEIQIAPWFFVNQRLNKGGPVREVLLNDPHQFGVLHHPDKLVRHSKEGFHQ